MMKLLFRRVKEGITESQLHAWLAGSMFLMLLPLPLLTGNPSQPAKAANAWQTKLVLAAASPSLLVTRDNVIIIEITPSRYQEEQTRLEAEAKAEAEAAKAKAEAQAKALAEARVAEVAQAATCPSDVSEAERWEWAGKAASAYNIDTKLLAAVWQAETGKRFCTSVQSSAGAMGPLQFMPGTWKRYAVDGNGDGIADPHDARDALFAAAKLLAANGADRGDLRRALFSYNHADWYVNKVLTMAGLSS